MVMTVLHPTGEVGPVGPELPQPDSTTANATHTGIRINIRNLPCLRITQLRSLRNARLQSAPNLCGDFVGVN